MTPAGEFPLRELFYRADRLARPETALPVREIDAAMGWCDAPGHPDYNRLVRLPFAASHEIMHRPDGLYDMVVVLGHNDSPPVPGAGSAIFMHVARGAFEPTEGCVALRPDDLRAVLAVCGPKTVIEIRDPEAPGPGEGARGP